jgi:type IV pilus assembly protein PilN
MARINLLPWREERRKEQKNRFFIALATATFLSALVVFLVDWHYGQKIAYQNSRNGLLESQITRLDAKIKEIQNLEKERTRLRERIATIEALQSSRPVAVHLFDELVTMLPEGVFLTEVAMTEKHDNEIAIKALTIKGIAESNARVSNFMRNIEASPWLRDPHLEIVETVTQDGRRLSQFTLDALEETSKSGPEQKGGTG